MNMTNIKKKFTFNTWFTGFFEGDGSFNINTNNSRCSLVINQKDLKVLIFIKNELKVGNIKEYSGYYRWVVSKKEELFQVILILNGSLILNKTNNKLKKWIDNYNIYYNLDSEDEYFILYKGPSVFDINNSWLAGFIDAEGCFNVRIVNFKKKKIEIINLIPEFRNELSHPASPQTPSLSAFPLAKREATSSELSQRVGWVSREKEKLLSLSSKSLLKKIKTINFKTSVSFRIRLRFLLKQKDEKQILDKIKNVFHGSVREIKQTTDAYEYVLDSNFRQIKIINYLNEHPLKSIKHINYLKFKNLYYQIQRKEHLNVLNIKRALKYLSYSKLNKR